MLLSSGRTARRYVRGMRVVIIGGGNAQWVPLLADDIAITSCLAGGELVLHDLYVGRLERTAGYANHVSA